MVQWPAWPIDIRCGLSGVFLVVVGDSIDATQQFLRLGPPLRVRVNEASSVRVSANNHPDILITQAKSVISIYARVKSFAIETPRLMEAEM